ncbi:MAG: LytR C-terminal domain-containing protein [Actinomycetia bacterium]|nr:LytR C-terminal domain-containing protein [Actinomycetes bacterium]
MTSPRGGHGSADGSFGRSAGNAAARGGLLVIIAVLIGLFLLRQGLDDEGAIVSVGSDDTSAEESTDTGSDDDAGTDGSDDGTGSADDGTESTASTTSSTLLPSRPAAEIKVKVANATTSEAGIAGEAVNFLITQGFNALSPKNARDEVRPIMASAVHYLPGWESEAVAVATAFGVDPATTVAIATETTNDIVESMDDATILVVLGDDGVIRAR